MRLKRFKIMFSIYAMMSMFFVSCGQKCCSDESTTPQHNTTPNEKSNVTKDADVKVRSLTVVEKGDTLIMTAEIGNEGDDDAQDTKATILLPVEAEVYSFAQTSATIHAFQCQGYVRCDIGNLNTRSYAEKDGLTSDRVSLVIKTSKSKKDFKGKETFGVFAYNALPDMNPENNYCYWKNNKTE